VTEPGRLFRIVTLPDDLDRSGFYSGVEALDRYLRQQAGQDKRRSVAVTHVLLDSASQILGYYTLSALSLVPTRIPADLARRLPRYPSLPALLIGRLAVDDRRRGQGLGRLLVADALRRCASIAREAGCIGVVVDAKDDTATAFYEHFGFIRLPDAERRLFLPMDVARTFLRAEPGRQSDDELPPGSGDQR
jgi:GNAT superfamily N-acetyltransferase